MQSVVVITPPEPILSLDLVRSHLRIDDDDSDALLLAFMAAAQGNIDGPGGWLGRALGVQTLELRLDSFFGTDWLFGACWTGWGVGEWDRWARPARFTTIPLPYPPFISVTSITYEDPTGTDQVLNADGWNATDEGLTPAFGDVWPAGRIAANAVRIRYQAGYANIPAQPPTDSIIYSPQSTLPGAVIPALLLMVADLWANREAQVIDTRAAVIQNPTVSNLLSPLRVYT